MKNYNEGLDQLGWGCLLVYFYTLGRKIKAINKNGTRKRDHVKDPRHFN